MRVVVLALPDRPHRRVSDGDETDYDSDGDGEWDDGYNKETEFGMDNDANDSNRESSPRYNNQCVVVLSQSQRPNTQTRPCLPCTVLCNTWPTLSTRTLVLPRCPLGLPDTRDHAHTEVRGRCRTPVGLGLIAV